MNSWYKVMELYLSFEVNNLVPKCKILVSRNEPKLAQEYDKLINSINKNPEVIKNMKKINAAINNEKKAINQYLLELVPESCRPYVEKAVEDLNKLNNALIKEIETLREEANARDEVIKILAKKIEHLETNNGER